MRIVFLLFLASTALHARPPEYFLSDDWQIMPVEKRLEYQTALPDVEDPWIQEVLRHPRTLWYTTAEMPRAYQKWRFTRFPGVHLASHQPDRNANNEFPWSKPGGTHLSNSETVKFAFTPDADYNNGFWPVVWHGPGEFGGWDPRQRFWTLPKDGIGGELIGIRHPETGKLRITEVRVFIRELDDWGVDFFRPYVTQDDLYQMLIELGHLKEAVGLAEAPIRAERLASEHNERPFDVTAKRQYVDEWPVELVDELFNVTFKSGVGVRWSSDADGPTTWANYHLWPRNTTIAHLGNDRNGCMQCHRDTGVHVSFFDFFDNRNWQGNVLGSGGNFSLNPFEPDAISSDGSATPTTDFGRNLMRKQFIESGFLEHYDPEKHPGGVYKLTSLEADNRVKDAVIIRRYPN